MVAPQVTHNSKSSHGDDESVRITAQQRRQVLREHYTERLRYQQAVVASEKRDREANGAGVPMFSRADVAVSNMIAVLQDISATLAAYSDNRDFGAVQS